MSQISLLLLVTLLNYKSFAYKLDNTVKFLEEPSQNIKVAETPFYLNNGQVFDNVLDLANATHVRSKRSVKLKVIMPSGANVQIPLPDSSSDRCYQANFADFISVPSRFGDTSEFETIVKEMEDTKINLPNCKQRGGCVAKYKIFKILKVTNGCLWKRYMDRKSDIESENKGNANERMLFFGTHDAWDVVDNGFDERYVAVYDRAFGAGVYFSTSSSAANELAYGKSTTGCPRHNLPDCTKCKRRMILARVTLGKVHVQVGAKKFAHAPVGYDSVIGNLTNIKNSYKDYIIYRGEQAYPEYMISYVIRTEFTESVWHRAISTGTKNETAPPLWALTNRSKNIRPVHPLYS